MFVCISPGKAIFEMTYTVSGGMLNPTHSLTLCERCLNRGCGAQMVGALEVHKKMVVDV